MDPLTLAANLSGVVSLTTSIFTASDSQELAERSKWTPVLSEAGNRCYLRVYDLGYSGSDSQRLVGTSNSLTTLNDALLALRPQETTIRVYIVEGLSMDTATLLAHLYPGRSPAAKSPFGNAENTFEALASQWKVSNAMTYESTMYSFEGTDYFPRKTHSQVNQGLAFLAGLIKLNMTVHVRDVVGTSDKSIIIISCEAEKSPFRRQYMEKYMSRKAQEEWKDIPLWYRVTGRLERFGRHLVESNDAYKQIPESLRSLQGYKQYLLLRYCGATIHQYSQFINTVRLEYVSQRETIMDPRYSVLRPSVLEQITADAYIFREFHDIALDLTDPATNLIAILESTFPDSNACKDFSMFIAELNCQSKEVVKAASRFSSLLEHNLKYLDVSRNMQESLRVWILSALASVFLPLSIATGLLSMQSRLIDLDILLYDFCGVVVLVGTVLLVAFHFLRGYVFLKEKFHAWTPTPGLQSDTKNFLRGNTATTFALGIWALVLASFLVGMINDSRLGGKILGIGLAALFGLFMLLVLFLGVLWSASEWFLELIRATLPLLHRML